jgi:hypothetical protein
MIGLAAGNIAMNINVLIFINDNYQLQLHAWLRSPVAQLILLVEFKVHRT